MVRRQGEGHFTTSLPTPHAHAFRSPTQGLTVPLRGLLGRHTLLCSRETKAQRIGSVGLVSAAKLQANNSLFLKRKGGTSKGKERVLRSLS